MRRPHTTLTATCTQCEFTRRFSPQLAGKFYRCPRCRQGVLAVPKMPASEKPRVEVFRLSSTSSFEFKAPVPVTPQNKETEENTAVGETALAHPAIALESDDTLASGSSVIPVLNVSDSSQDASVALPDPDAIISVDEAARSAGAQEDSDNRGEVATARRILVECGLCSFLVRIPAEFFGKTVHCPSCAGNTVFTESTLEPVKDELLDRLAMETQERQYLFPHPEEAPPSGLARVAPFLRGHAVRSFLVGVGLGLVVLLGLWTVVRFRGVQARGSAVERALEEGWRYGANLDSDLFHEPWCRALDPDRPGRRVTQDEFERAGDLKVHDCR